MEGLPEGIDSKFRYVLLVAKRAEQLVQGSMPKSRSKHSKPTRVAMEEIEKKLAKLSSHNKAKQKFLTRTNYYGQVVEVDGQGRILIPPVLRESAQMKGEVDIQGQLTYLEVCNHAQFLEQMNRNPMTAEDEQALDGLGI